VSRPLAIAALLALFALGALALFARPVYDYAWSHPSVMLLGQFACLAAALFAARWRARVGLWLAVGIFGVVSGATAIPLVMRASALLGGIWPALGLAAAALAAAQIYLMSRNDCSGP
jgi:hypothetical protein